MRVLVCIKRVPLVGGKITLREDSLAVDTKYLGFTFSPHEECAVEEAVRITEQHGGSATVMTLGPPEATEQLQFAMSLGVHDAVLLEDGGHEWGPMATAAAIAEDILEQQQLGKGWDLILFGTDAPDSGDYQVGARVAEALGMPYATGIKGIEIGDAGVVLRRENGASVELTAMGLPAVVAVKEGLNLPRYPSLPGRLRAKSKPIRKATPSWQSDPNKTVRFRLPAVERSAAIQLGEGVEAVDSIIALLKDLGMVAK